MLCRYCGNLISEGSRFCDSCGRQASHDIETPAPNPKSPTNHERRKPRTIWLVPIITLASFVLLAIFAGLGVIEKAPRERLFDVNHRMQKYVEDGDYFCENGEHKKAAAKYGLALSLEDDLEVAHRKAFKTSLPKYSRAGFAEAAYRASNCYKDIGDLKQAIAMAKLSISKFERLNGNSPMSAYERRTLSEYYSQIADLYRRVEQLDISLKSLDKAVKLNPENPQAFILRGLVLEARGDQAGANSSYNAALDIEPYNNQAAGLLARGQIYTQAQLPHFMYPQA